VRGGHYDNIGAVITTTSAARLAELPQAARVVMKAVSVACRLMASGSEQKFFEAGAEGTP